MRVTARLYTDGEDGITLGAIVTFIGLNGPRTKSVLKLDLVPAIGDEPLCDVLPLGGGKLRSENPLGPLGLVAWGGVRSDLGIP
jgi:hypothetical protein